MFYLETHSSLCSTWVRSQSQEIGKSGRGSLLASYAGKFHSCKGVESKWILTNAPTQGDLERRITGSRYPRPTSRFWSLGYIQQYDRRACINAMHSVHIRYSKPLHCIRTPSIRADSPVGTIQHFAKPYWVDPRCNNAGFIMLIITWRFFLVLLPNPRICKSLHFRTKLK